MADINKTQPEQTTQLLRLRYSHVETLVGFGLVGLITVGGFVCIFCNIQCGQTIVVGVLSFITGGWVGTRTLKRSGTVKNAKELIPAMNTLNEPPQPMPQAVVHRRGRNRTN
jgi:hypothetical protein